jgi:ApbE superfamily uncharacterized protein (UPF0280 family)
LTPERASIIIRDQSDSVRMPTRCLCHLEIRMPAVQNIYEIKDYKNRIPLANSVNFNVDVRETSIHIQARVDLSAKAKESVFRYRYQIEEYLRQHPALRETETPIQTYSAAPEIVRYCDLSSRNTGVAPMSCMSGAMADFVGRDLTPASDTVIVSSGADSFIHSSNPLEVFLYCKGSPFHDQLVLKLENMKNVFGLSTYAPGRGIHAVTVLSRSACWAASFAKDLGMRLVSGESLKSTLNRAEAYSDVGGIIIIAGSKIVAGGAFSLMSVSKDRSIEDS